MHFPQILAWFAFRARKTGKCTPLHPKCTDFAVHFPRIVAGRHALRRNPCTRLSRCKDLGEVHLCSHQGARCRFARASRNHSVRSSPSPRWPFARMRHAEHTDTANPTAARATNGQITTMSPVRGALDELDVPLLPVGFALGLSGLFGETGLSGLSGLLGLFGLSGSPERTDAASTISWPASFLPAISSTEAWFSIF